MTTIEENQQRYMEAAHAMQSGVMVEIGSGNWAELGAAAASPKQLRTGVNAAMVEHSALAQLLIKKGVITEAEMWQSLADAMDAEVAKYEARINKGRGGGPKVRLA